MIKVESILLHYKQTFSMLHCTLLSGTFQHTNIAERAILFWWVESSREAVLDHLSYQPHGEAPTTCL